MTEHAVQLRNVTKIYGDARDRDAVAAVKDVDLAIEGGEFFTLLGPSGCGKTTTLRLIAGFETPTEGEIFVQDRPMQNTAPNQRPINTVFQSYALFPHLTVGENVAFGLRVKRVPKAEQKQRVREALEMVRLPDTAERKPSQLSGGQQQRIALARAIINRPVVLLLDEPLGALDLKLRKEMQLELKQLQTQLGITFIYVTHDQEEALTMSDRIAVMHGGAVQQIAAPETLYEQPANRFVADFIGESNFLPGEVREVRNGRATLAIAGLETPLSLPLDGAPLHRGDAVTLTVRPEKLMLLPVDAALNGRASNSGNAKSGGAEPSGVVGTVSEVVYLGTDTRYRVALPTDDVLIVRQPNLSGGARRFAAGERVRIDWQTSDLRVLRE